ncbi:MAG: hypothetical protein L0H19_08250, partial [Salinisphaera sp.]|nr:hypothetical protein [Salinisphaera sp.]
MQQFGEWTAGLMEMRHVWGRAFDMALVVIAVLVVNLVLRLGLRYLARRVEQSPRVWDDALYHSLAAPLRVVVW